MFSSTEVFQGQCQQAGGERVKPGGSHPAARGGSARARRAGGAAAAARRLRQRQERAAGGSPAPGLPRGTLPGNPALTPGDISHQTTPVLGKLITNARGLRPKGRQRSPLSLDGHERTAFVQSGCKSKKRGGLFFPWVYIDPRV